VVEQRGYIVAANRRLVTSQGEKTREEKVPIHVADVVRMTATFAVPLSLPEVAEGTLPGPGPTPVQPQVGERAPNNISLTSSRKRRDRP
jgi:hypothetical protein